MTLTLENNYWTEIDMIPLVNYRKALTGKPAYCRKVWNEGSEQLDLQAWQMVYDDYLRVFGLGDRYESYVDIQIELIETQLEYAETGERVLLNTIERLEAELERMTAGEKMDMDDLIVYVMRSGYSIDERTITAKMFFKMLDNCVKENKAKNGKANKERRDS